MQRYRTEYPNQVHLLAVSVSKHLWVTKDGTLKYQQKPLDVDLKKLRQSSRTHIVLFGIRDHTSGVVYGETAVSNDLPSLADFLYRAWSPKDELAFRGMPELIGIPKTVERAYPRIRALLEELGVSLADITSGFQGGAGLTKGIEQSLLFDIDKPVAIALKRSKTLASTSPRDVGRTGKRTKLEMWETGVPDRLLDGPPQEWLDKARDQTIFSLS